MSRDPVEVFPLHLQRNAFGPRDTARAGDLWRLCQDAAVIGSSRRGWPPARYREESCAFVVRSMRAVHHHQTAFGEPLIARTWVSTFRRGMFSDRQIRIETEGKLVLAATQRWVHVVLPDLKPARASESLEASFGLHSPEGDGDIELPAWDPADGEPHTFSFEAWYTWMDPLAHANHPLYLDWADEATSRRVAAAGLDPYALLPIAEEVTWRSGVLAPERMTVESRKIGVLRREEGLAVALSHRFLGQDGRLCAEATTIRALDGRERERLGEVVS